MNRIATLLAGISALMLAGSIQAASLYNFSYDFGSGNQIRGRVIGDANGDLLTNLTDIMIFVDGNAFPGNGSLIQRHWDSNDRVYYDGGAVMSFSGSANNFLFTNTPTGGAFFGIVPTPIPPYFGAALGMYIGWNTTPGRGDSAQENFHTASWSLTAASVVQNTQAGVPEPASIALTLLGLSLMILRHRRV